jgi:hypothetical protein
VWRGQNVLAIARSQNYDLAMNEKTPKTIDELLKTTPDRRDPAWEQAFLKALPQAPAQVLFPDPKPGPDGWPYLFVEVGAAGDDRVINIIQWLATRGIGLAMNPQKDMPDYVLSYGMVWNFKERGEFLTEVAPVAAGEIEITEGQKFYAGVPTESYLPSYVRKTLREFFMDQNVLAPKILLLSEDGLNFDLCFSLESLRSPPQVEHAGIAEAISWFLPGHYSLILMSEKVIPGFQPL